MIPFGLSPEQFRERYRRDLQRAAPGVIQRLRELLRQPLEEGLRDGEIQLFLGEDGRDAAEAWLYLNGASNRVDASDPRLFPGKALDLALGLGHARISTKPISPTASAASICSPIRCKPGSPSAGGRPAAGPGRSRYGCTYTMASATAVASPSPNAAEQGDHAWN